MRWLQKKKEQRSLFLMIRMARVQFEDDDYAVVYFEKEDSTVVAGTGPDPELGLENLVELKHQMMTRNVQSDIVDRALKPDSKARDALELAIQVGERTVVLEMCWGCDSRAASVQLLPSRLRNPP